MNRILAGLAIIVAAALAGCVNPRVATSNANRLRAQGEVNIITGTEGMKRFIDEQVTDDFNADKAIVVSQFEAKRAVASGPEEGIRLFLELQQTIEAKRLHWENQRRIQYQHAGITTLGLNQLLASIDIGNEINEANQATAVEMKEILVPVIQSTMAELATHLREKEEERRAEKERRRLEEEAAQRAEEEAHAAHEAAEAAKPKPEGD